MTFTFASMEIRKQRAECGSCVYPHSQSPCRWPALPVFFFADVQIVISRAPFPLIAGVGLARLVRFGGEKAGT
jgi:hypothetical protein